MAHLMERQQEELAEGLRRGDARAFSAVAAAYVDAVFRQALLLLGSASDAEDATQEVLLKLFQEGPRLRGNRLSGWVATICHHHCVDVLRARSRHPAVPTDPDRMAHLPARADPETACGLPEVLQSLPARDREILALRILDGLPPGEIAEIVGLAPGTVSNIVSRCLSDLRERASAWMTA